MPTPTCPWCRRTIPREDINVGENVAYCRECHVANLLSDLAQSHAITEVNLDEPPEGAWLHHNEWRTEIGATNRSAGSATVFLFFALFWNGIVSVFVAIAVYGTLKNLHMAIPKWLPAIQFEGGVMSPRMAICLWLFLLPFIAVGLGMTLMVLLNLFGQTLVEIEDRRDGVIFVGFGSRGWRWKFNAADVTSVRLVEKTSEDGKTSFIRIETRQGKQIDFGTLLTPERRQFMLGALQNSLRVGALLAESIPHRSSLIRD